MAQEQKCCVSDMGHLIPQIKSTTTTKTHLCYKLFWGEIEDDQNGVSFSCGCTFDLRDQTSHITNAAFLFLGHFNFFVIFLHALIFPNFVIQT